MNIPINLFEYQNKIKYDDSINLEKFLDNIWKNREKNPYFRDDEDNKYLENQQFIQFLHNTNEIKSNKYAGVIHFNNNTINLLPKIFYDQEENITAEKLGQINNHILWWLSYCKKIRFPNYQTPLGKVKDNFFEIMIYLFSKYTKELLNKSVYMQYQDIIREVEYIRGRININEYINSNLSTGKWNKFNCTYDLPVIDNKLNRIIKYVANTLVLETSNKDSEMNLREILFMLDEVKDIIPSPESCLTIEFNPMFAEFEIVRDYCYLFLSNSISYNYKNNFRIFAFILPMEYVFEDFIYGFIEKETKINVTQHRSDVYLTNNNKYKLIPDYIIEEKNNTIIADAKYKLIYAEDNNKDISQKDLYQMVSYAIRFNVSKCILFYPETIGHLNKKTNKTSMEIEDRLAHKNITIRAYQLPIINRNILNKKTSNKYDLKELFRDINIDLVDTLNNILKENTE